MKWLYLYIIDGIPAVAISIRPLDALHVKRRMYHKISGSTIIRFVSSYHKLSSHIDKGTGCQILILALKGGE